MPPFQGGHNVCCNISLSRCDLPNLSPMRAARLCLSHAVLLSFMSHSVGGCLRQREASVPCDSDTPEPARRSVGMTRSRRCVALDRRRERDMVGGRRSRPRTRMDSALPVQAPNRARARACRRGRQVAAGRRLRPLTGNMRLSAERKCGPARTRQECDEGGNTDKARVRTGLGRWRGMRRVWGRRGRQGTGFTPDDIYSHVRDVALFRGSGPIVMLHSQRVITVAPIFAPTHPPSVILRPDSWAGPGRTASASRRRSPHRVPRLRCTGRGLFRPGPEAWGPPGGLRPGGWPDQDRVTRTTRTHSVAARAGPGQCPGEGTTGPGDSDASQRAG